MENIIQTATAVRNYDCDYIDEETHKKVFYVTVETEDDVVEYISFDDEREASSYVDFFNGFVKYINK
jgi:hypothetical protein